MKLEQALQAVSAMPVADRLRLAEAIWDSLPDCDVPPLTSSQQAELRRRLAEHDADPSAALSREEVESRLAELRCRTD